MICELNPLHNGHLHMLDVMRRDDEDAAILLVMSGNYTQRAESAAFDKYARARAAVESGADIVVELPFPFSSAGAERFARAGVRIAEALGATKLYFGSECGDIERLRTISRVTGSEEYRALSAKLAADDPGLGAAALREAALAKLIPGEAQIRTETPNDTLAIEYIRNAHIPCAAVGRVETPGASAIRQMSALEAAPFVPEATKRMMENEKRSDVNVLRRLIWENLRLRFVGSRRGGVIAGVELRRDISVFAECGGGLGDRLLRLAGGAADAQEFFAAAATKKYTNARIRRAALYALCAVEPEDVASPALFTVLLAANEKGREVLAAVRKDCAVAVMTKPANALSRAAGNGALLRAVDLAMFADSIYTLTFTPPLSSDDYIRRTPYIVRIEVNEKINQSPLRENKHRR